MRLGFHWPCGIDLLCGVVVPYRIENGLNWKGASIKWYQAMQAGNGQEAVFWAKRIEAYSQSFLRDTTYQNLAQAYELDGQHEIAEHYYALSKLLQHEDIPPPK